MPKMKIFSAPTSDTVPVTDPDHSISKTHLAVLLDGDRLSVRELGSTNCCARFAAT